MGTVYAILLSLLVCYNVLLHTEVRCGRSLSLEEEFDIERQLKLLNKPAAKTLMNKYGDIHDCVDFYKQPAFDHPLWKNRTIKYPVKSDPLYYKKMGLDFSDSRNAFPMEDSEDEVCPDGTVPIRRISRDDLIRMKRAFVDEREQTANQYGPMLAGARLAGHPVKSSFGASGEMSVHNPKVVDSNSFSTTRIRIQSSGDAIEAGWRVDPALYGDNQTRFFIRTDTDSGSHCFNTLCPAFVQTYKGFGLDSVLPVPPRGEAEFKTLAVTIQRDPDSGDWMLLAGPNNTLLGYWPMNVFSQKGLGYRGNIVQWGGAVRTPGVSIPQMGAGAPREDNIRYDGHFTHVKIVRTESGLFVDPENTELEMRTDDPQRFFASDLGFLGALGRTFIYGSLF